MRADAIQAVERAAHELGWPYVHRPAGADSATANEILFEPEGVHGGVVVIDVQGTPQLFAAGSGTILPLAARWPRGVASWDELASALRSVVTGEPPVRLAFGTGGKPLTRDAEKGARFGWSAMFAGDDALPDVRGAAAQRTGVEVADTTAKAHVVVVGLGSVGSYIVEQLARSGVGSFTVIDDDTVEPHNLSRTTYDACDIGRPKAFALEARLAQIDPRIVVEPIALRFDEIAVDDLRRIFGIADLIIAATDDPRTQLLINRCAWKSGRPSLYVGLFEGAHAGEIGYVLPGITRCFWCFVGSSRDNASRGTRSVDYGLGGRIKGEVALASDIHHVSGAATKIALAILAAASATGGEGRLARFLLGAAAEERSYIHMAMEPNWSGFAGRFDRTAGQYAWQSVWMAAAPDQSCRICGADPDTSDPFEDIAPPPDASNIRAELID
jgi:molybdopterin/thiamine biosynthesis adenylyltransferase